MNAHIKSTDLVVQAEIEHTDKPRFNLIGLIAGVIVILGSITIMGSMGWIVYRGIVHVIS